MTELIPLIQRMHTVVQAGASNSSSLANILTAEKLVNAIIRKIAFERIHLSMLSELDWDRVDELSRSLNEDGRAPPLIIETPEFRLAIVEPKRVLDYVYLAFDGLMSSLVNITDTFCRWLIICYDLKVPPRMSNLLGMKDSCKSYSSLGKILCDGSLMDWLVKAREVRGECQHNNVNAVLKWNVSEYGRTSQPVVDKQYHWLVAARDMLVSEYAQDAMAASLRCMTAAIHAVASSPRNPTV